LPKLVFADAEGRTLWKLRLWANRIAIGAMPSIGD